jgi:hypothetical protein
MSCIDVIFLLFNVAICVSKGTVGCGGTLGRNLIIPNIDKTLSAATNTKVILQPKFSPIRVPKGTPNTKEALKPIKISPIARPLSSVATVFAAIVIETTTTIEQLAASITLAINKVVKLGLNIDYFGIRVNRSLYSLYVLYSISSGHYGIIN